MSSKHLETGDSKPAFDGAKKFRIYSMKFCPFAQREPCRIPVSNVSCLKELNKTLSSPLFDNLYAILKIVFVTQSNFSSAKPKRSRLVAVAKGLTDYDIVNIKLRDNLPEWYPSINPMRAVPAIEFADGEAIYESLIVSDLLDDLYPEKQLNPKDPKEKARQKLFVDRFGSTFIPSYYKHLKDAKRSEETKQELLKNISTAEKYLADNKSKFFGGKEAGMLDFMLWPWFERLPVMYSLSADLHPNMTNWFNLMHKEPAVMETAFSKENHMKFYESYIKGQPDYDFV